MQTLFVLLCSYSQFLANWKLFVKKNQTEKDGKGYAKDEGGPTRQFLSDVFLQLNKLSVLRKKGDKQKLFDDQQDEFLLPLPLNDELISLEEKNKAKRYYRAIGRIIAYCIIHNYPIPEQVLSPIHRAYLFQGFNPAEKYPLYQLCHDFSRMQGEHTYDIKKKYTEDILRELVLDTYIDGMSFALNALREGITLNGIVTPDCTECCFMNIVLTSF